MTNQTIVSNKPELGSDGIVASEPPAMPTSAGSVQVLRAISSPQIDNQRDILVYLPPGYQDTDTRYPVLYLHGGQNHFDETTSDTDEWQIDSIMQRLGQS